MFNLFKKEKAQSKTILKGNYPKEVLEIHHEFEMAAENLLIEAKSIIKEAESKDTKKVFRLENLGFKQASQVTELKPLIQKSELSKEQLELLNHYSISYPNNKFITEDHVKTICHKYNLVCGEVERFRGFVPEKNLKEIESFKLKQNEKFSFICEGKQYGGGLVSFTINNAEICKDGEYYFFVKKGTKRDYDKNNYAFQSGDGVSFYSKDKYNVFGLEDIGNVQFTVNNSLKICAPVKDMDLTGLELVEGYKLQKKHIPDPVVLHPVRGGYLILTAWGDEASDELVVNQKFN